MKQALVTGGTSGIGLAVAKALSAEGYHVYTFSRRGGKGLSAPGSMVHMAVDVTDEDAVKRAVREIADKEGRLDLVVNAAGYGISGSIEFTPVPEAKKLLETDFFGTVNVCSAAIPFLRRQAGRHGRQDADSPMIVNISSVAGPAAIPFQAYYSCSKAAIDDYTAALANELRQFGVRVCAVRPGDVKTGFTKARRKHHEGDEIYHCIDASVAKMEHDEKTGYDPSFIARKVVRLTHQKHPKPFTTPGVMYAGAVVLIKLLPCRLVNFLIGKLYIQYEKK